MHDTTALPLRAMLRLAYLPALIPDPPTIPRAPPFQRETDIRQYMLLVSSPLAVAHRLGNNTACPDLSRKGGAPDLGSRFSQMASVAPVDPSGIKKRQYAQRHWGHDFAGIGKYAW